jgi:hypothetical protein
VQFLIGLLFDIGDYIMKKLLIAIFVATLLGTAASVRAEDADTEQPTIVIEPVKSAEPIIILNPDTMQAKEEPKKPKRIQSGNAGAGVKVTYDDNDEWVSITATATAKVGYNVDYAVDTAITVATLKARRQILEMLNVTMKSGRSVEMTSNTSQGTKNASNVLEKVRDSITKMSEGVMKGTHVVSEIVDAENRQVTVTVGVDRRSLNAAKSIATITLE